MSIRRHLPCLLCLLITSSTEAFVNQRRRPLLQGFPSQRQQQLKPPSPLLLSSKTKLQLYRDERTGYYGNNTTFLIDDKDTTGTHTFDQDLFVQELEKQFYDLQQITTTLSSKERDAMYDSYLLSSSALMKTEAGMSADDIDTVLDVGVINKKEDESELWKARLLLIGAAALYGTNFSLVKLLGDTMPVGVSTTLRFGLAAIATMPWLIKDLSPKNKDSLSSAWLGFEVGLWTSIGYVAQAVGLETTPASESAFICSLAVVTVPLMDALSGKKLLPKQWTGAILAVLGVAFLELGDMLTSFGTAATPGALDTAIASTGITTGDMLSLIQPFAFGMGFWRMEHAMTKFPNEAPRMTAAQLFAVFLSSLAYGLWAIDTPTLQSFPWQEWLTSTNILFSLFWTGVVTTALTIYMETLAMKTLSAAETTLIFSTEPLWGTAFAALVMGEQLGPNVAVGAAFILTACLYSNLGKEGIMNLLGTSSSIVEDSKHIASNNLRNGNGATVKTQVRGMRPSMGAVYDLPTTLQKQWVWLTSGVSANWLAWSKVTQTIPTNIQITLEDLQETPTLDEFFRELMVVIQNSISYSNNPNDVTIMLEHFVKHTVS